MHTLIIAEAGVNHNGDMNMARQLIEAAADAGADMVKFQTFKADRLVTPDAQKADYQKVTTAGEGTQYQMLRKLELSDTMHADLIAHCQKVGIEFCSTGFDIQSLHDLVAMGVNVMKIPSGEITNLPYLRAVAGFGLPVILSTGMATLGDVELALDVLEQAGTAREQITVLHCTTEYPAPMQDVNLHAMQSMGLALGVDVGYSDHTVGIEVPTAAIALGATVIEKHFTLDKTLPGPDHQASLAPDELKAMVSAIRNIEHALGDGIKRPTEIERKNMQVARKSVVAARDIAAGEVFTEENLTVKRPGTGISPMFWDEVIGQMAKRDFAQNELVEL
ncbi:N-acetylneuraminate synthase [Cohaesibacter gelatinilyticus]|uniref:N-acetylneuraminate synthase n=1 Tax=Cohaesibacter gelatinilyticus TaxID=372072 RepID=A0A285PEF9_9HYPH|nr:N-acetylneuraminate synthase [Cohaesibacter gelatinilyticus]SNZ20124.1 N-acetylneuraminate synthase [Cohaesibacter gelatinilyticus]